MSYIDDIASALTRVISVANDGPEEKFAGYAAVRSFWVAEAAHCLSVIGGYPERFARMHEASAKYLSPVVDWPNRLIGQASSNERALHDATRNVQQCMRRFLKRCLKLDPCVHDEINKDCKKLGLPTPLYKV